MLSRVEKKIRDMRISFKEVISSVDMRNYLTRLISVALTGINASGTVRLAFYDEKQSKSPKTPEACTDGKTIWVNVFGGFFMKAARSKTEKLSIVIGKIAHELGHVFFTDVNSFSKEVERIADEKKLDVPKKAGLERELSDITEFLTEHPESTSAFSKELAELNNILEDGYIEARLYDTISGVLIDGLNVIRRKQKHHFPALREELAMYERLEEEQKPKALLSIIHGLLLSYAKYGLLKVNWRNPDETESEPVQWVSSVKKDVSMFLNEDSSIKRTKISEVVFAKLWPVIKPTIPTGEDAKDGGEGDGKPTASPHPAGSTAPTGGSGVMKRSEMKPKSKGKDSDEKRKRTDKALEESSKKRDEKSKDETTVPSDEDKDTSPPDEKGGVPAKGATPEEEGMCEDRPEGELSELDIDDEVDDTSDIEKAFDKIERDIAERAAIDAVNDDIKSELSEDIKKTDLGPLSVKSATEVRRINRVDESTKKLYNENSKTTVEPMARVMAKTLAPLLKKRRDDAALPMSGFFSGSKFDATRLVSADCRPFKRNATPEPDRSAAICVLVDESASMHGARIDAARMAALTVYLFAQECGIPCSVMGHTENFHGKNELVINSYSVFDSPDKDDKYRILSIRAREDNRDGAAIRFAGAELMKRKEAIKILFSISDGVPCAHNYYGSAANKDTKDAIEKLRHDGALVFAAAIGGDKPAIKQIYTDGFVDINDLTTLPGQMLSIIKRFVK